MRFRRWAVDVVWPEPFPARQVAVGGFWTRWGARAAAARSDRYRVLLGGEWRFEVVRDAPR